MKNHLIRKTLYIASFCLIFSFSVLYTNTASALTCGGSDNATCQLTGDCHSGYVPSGTCAFGAGTCCIPTDPEPPADSNYAYTPLEPIFEGDTDGSFVHYIQMIYKFMIWSVGIAALLMLSIGGFMYITSAGNQANAETAKKLIKDALLGLVIVLVAWIILYLINPDLVKINLESIRELEVPINGPQYSGSSGDPLTPSSGGKGSGGNCDVISSGACSPEHLKSVCTDMTDADAQAMSQVCSKESAGDASSSSGSDICTNYGNKSFSIGLYQINLFANGSKYGAKCANLGSKGSCTPGYRRPDRGNVCLGWTCKINNMADFDYCADLAREPEKNTQVMCDLSGSGQNRSPWACSANQCGVGGVRTSLSNFCL